MESDHRKVVILITKRDKKDDKECKYISKCESSHQTTHSPHPETQTIRKTIIVAASLITALFFLCLVFMIFKRYYSYLRRRRRLSASDQQQQQQQQEDFLDEDHGPMAAVEHHVWYINTVGLPQSVIDSIGICKYTRRGGGGPIEGTECSVCLSEFEEGEDVRLLPKCTHAFHIGCIDTWLGSHKNCPLCRAPVVCENAAPAVEESSAAESVVVVEEGESSSSGGSRRALMRRSASMEVLGSSHNKSLRRSLDRSISMKMPFSCGTRLFISNSYHRRIQSSILPS